MSACLCLTCHKPTQLCTEGGIFWCYGLLTFARFLGSFGDLGWAWNVTPSGNFYTAEFTESFIIFLYGATNTWMERFGANPGDPFTTKQIQHISIAVRAMLFMGKFAFLPIFFTRLCFALLDSLEWGLNQRGFVTGSPFPLFLYARMPKTCHKRQWSSRQAIGEVSILSRPW